MNREDRAERAQFPSHIWHDRLAPALLANLKDGMPDSYAYARVMQALGGCSLTKARGLFHRKGTPDIVEYETICAEAGVSPDELWAKHRCDEG